MNAFFNSLKTDLFDRRLTPALAILGAALLAAIVYATIGGGSSSTVPATSAPVAAPKASGIAVTAAASTKTSVAETTSGAAEQTVGGAARNPFKPLPGVTSAAAAAKTASSSGASASTGTTATGGSGGSGGASSSGSGASGSEGSNAGGSGSEPTSQGGGTQPKKKPSRAYKVSILFGTAPAGTPVLTAGLTSYEHLKRQQPLPSATQPLIVFRGVVAGGKSATFTLVGEAILRGGAACLPSTSQCQAIDLKEGDTEELEYVPLGGTAITYELHVVKIEAITARAARMAKAATAAGVAGGNGGESKAGLQILREYGLVSVPGLRYSRDGSVLVFRGTGSALLARAHASAWGAAFKH
jgi:hypothetical protein